MSSRPTGPIQFDRRILADYDRARRHEWLLTNGLGGYASSTVVGANTRGYHGLLVASHPPGLTRTLLLAKLEEELQLGEQTYPLSVNQYRDVLHPQGHQLLETVRLDPAPLATYAVQDVHVRKRVRMVEGRNATVVTYAVRGNPHPLPLRLAPLVACRDFHLRMRADGPWKFQQEWVNGTLILEALARAPKLYLRCEPATYAPTGWWYRGLRYEEEEARGLDPLEDLYNPGAFAATVPAGGAVRLVASDHVVTDAEFQEWTQHEGARRGRRCVAPEGTDAFLERLVRAANQFVISTPDQEARTILAGYHWFGEWGRDSAIALPGLLLVTGRYADAKMVLRRFLGTLREGLIAVRFNGTVPEYDSVDTSLWFVYAVEAYLRYTGDLAFAREVYPSLRAIVEAYARGTRYGIRMTDDGLIVTPPESSGLTWMDARVEEVPVTRRSGGAVEVNALWYNALRVVARLAAELGADEADYAELASRTQETFNDRFWNAKLRCLYDVVGDDAPDAAVRPNQLFAISLPFPVLDEGAWAAVLAVVERDLLTPVGLRSLAPTDPRYCGRYQGDARQRDATYHQGTVWAWLLGPLVTAYVKVTGKRRTPRLQQVWRALDAHLREAGVGAISEIFDGDEPHHPRGCIAQAWSVAEVLRAYYEDIRGGGPGARTTPWGLQA